MKAAPDPTQNISFNLQLTAEQQQSRAQVPLPYAHEGKFKATISFDPFAHDIPFKGNPIPAQSAAIFYDPDSADDIDDDDPDEDLDL